MWECANCGVSVTNNDCVSRTYGAGKFTFIFCSSSCANGWDKKEEKVSHAL